MRSATGVLAAFIVLALPVIGGTAEKAASFAERWPQTPMPEPTMSEEVRLVAIVAKRDITAIIEAALPGAPRKSPRCATELCRALGVR